MRRTTTRKKPKKRPLRTTKAKVRAALRQLWMRSTERSQAMKRDSYTCQACQRKQSKAKGQEFAVNVHHIESINWDSVLDKLTDDRYGLFCHPDNLQVLCEECHKEEHNNAS